MIETIKEFLVSLGFSVDNASLNAARRAMSEAESSVSSFANSSLTNFAKAGAAVTSFVVVANIALAKFMSSLAQADLQNEMFARRMWMNADAAKAFTSSIDALGVSLQDLYLSPELLQRYLSLNGQARGMAVPADEYKKQMQGVRDITFEFQRLKLEGTYALQWIGYYLTKYLAGPLGDLKNWLGNINETIQKKMPEWTAKVAMVVSWVGKLGVAMWRIKDALLAVAAILAGRKILSMLTSPIGALIFGMMALLLLVDDFETHGRKGKSAFPALWEWVDGIGKSLEKNGLTFEKFKKDLGDIAKSAFDLGETIDKLIKKLGVKGGLAEVIKTGILSTLELLDDVLISINAQLKILNDFISGDIGILDILSGKVDKKYGNQEPEDNGKVFPMDEAVKNFFKNMSDFFSNHSLSSFKSGISPMSYMYPQNNPSGATHVTMSPTYNIYGATNPNAVVTTIHRSNKDMITRTFQGVVK